MDTVVVANLLAQHIIAVAGPSEKIDSTTQMGGFRPETATMKIVARAGVALNGTAIETGFWLA